MSKSTRIFSMVCYAILLLTTRVFSQEDVSFSDKITHFPDRVLNKIHHKTRQLNDNLVAQTQRYLLRLQKQESRLKRRLSQKDSSAAERIFGNVEFKYSQFKSALMNEKAVVSGLTNKYIPHLDTLQTVFNFLQEHDDLIKASPEAQQRVKTALADMNALQHKFNQTEEISRYLKQRRSDLQSELQRHGLSKQLKEYKKQVYYYQAQVQEYKAIFEDPSRLEVKAIQLLSKTSAFKNFFASHSQLANMFRMPGSSAVSTPSVALAGLQTRDAIQRDLVQRFGGGADVQQAMQQQVKTAQTALTELKDKISQLGEARVDQELPDFKPNNQKTKTFKSRLEFGTNLQTVKADRFFPSTSDVGLSVGYRLNDKSIIGLGSAFKIGWGRDIRHIVITNQGIGIRSFVDYKFKGSFFLSGGYEQNYRTMINSITELRNGSSWQSSGLIGLSKKYSVSNKLKGSAQLLFDFLSYQQIPRTQPLLFRFTYTLK